MSGKITEVPYRSEEYVQWLEAENIKMRERLRVMRENPFGFVDHVDGDKSNNTTSNLRILPEVPK